MVGESIQASSRSTLWRRESHAIRQNLAALRRDFCWLSSDRMNGYPAATCTCNRFAAILPPLSYIRSSHSDYLSVPEALMGP